MFGLEPDFGPFGRPGNELGAVFGYRQVVSGLGDVAGFVGCNPEFVRFVILDLLRFDVQKADAFAGRNHLIESEGAGRGDVKNQYACHQRGNCQSRGGPSCHWGLHNYFPGIRQGEASRGGLFSFRQRVIDGPMHPRVEFSAGLCLQLGDPLIDVFVGRMGNSGVHAGLEFFESVAVAAQDRVDGDVL